MKQLIEKRDGLIAQMEAMKTNLVNEKRTAFNADERSKFDSLKKEVVEMNTMIEDEKFIDEQKRSEVKSYFNSNNRQEKQEFNLGKALRDFAEGNEQTGVEREFLEEGKKELQKSNRTLSKNQFYIPSSYVRAMAEKRAQTTSNSSAIQKVNQSSNLSFVGKPVLYNQIGVTVYDGLVGGALDLVSASDFSVTVGSENTTISDVVVTPAKATLTPKAYNATASFTRELLAQTNPAISAQIMDKFVYAIDAEIDRQMFKAFSAMTNTIVSASTYTHLLQLEAGTNRYPTALIASFRGRNYWKSKVRQAAATDSKFVWDDDNTVMGYPAYASPQVANGLIVLGDMSEVAVGKWDGLVILKDEFSNKRNNLIDFSVIQMADVKVVNTAAFAITKSGSFI